MRLVVTPPPKGANFLPPLSEIASITIEYTALTNDTNYFANRATTVARRAGAATFTNVEVTSSASTEPPAPSKVTVTLSDGAIAGIAIGVLVALAVMFMLGRRTSPSTAGERSGLLG